MNRPGDLEGLGPADFVKVGCSSAHALPIGLQREADFRQDELFNWHELFASHVNRRDWWVSEGYLLRAIRG